MPWSHCCGHSRAIVAEALGLLRLHRTVTLRPCATYKRAYSHTHFFFNSDVKIDDQKFRNKGQYASNKFECTPGISVRKLTLNNTQRGGVGTKLRALGTLLGDACIPIDKRIPGLRVQFIQTIARENYIWHLYAIFRDFVGTPPKVLHHRGGGTRDYQCIRFQT